MGRDAVGSSLSALEWIEEVVRDPAVTLVDARTARVHLTQADLARRDRLSPGTVNYRLDKLGVVVTQRRGGLVVDLAALAAARREADKERLQSWRGLCAVLAETWGRPGSEPGEVQLAVGGWRRPSCADVADLLGVTRSTAQSHLTRLEREGLLVRSRQRVWLTPLAGAAQAVAGGGTSSPTGVDPTPPQPATPAAPGLRPSTGHPADPVLAALQVIGQGFEALHVLAESLGALVDRLPADAVPRTGIAQITREAVAQFAELRDEVSRICGTEETDRSEKVPTGNEKPDLSGLTSANSQPPSARRQFADAPSDAEHEAADPTSTMNRGGTPVGADAVPELLADVCALCRQLGLPDDLDARGCEALGRLSEPQLAFATERLERELRADPKRYKRPLGPMVKSALNGDVDRFPVPPPPPTPITPPGDREHDLAESHVSDLESDSARSAELAALDDAISAERPIHPLAQRRLPGGHRANRGVDHRERVAYIEELLRRGEALPAEWRQRRKAEPVP